MGELNIDLYIKSYRDRYYPDLTLSTNELEPLLNEINGDDTFVNPDSLKKCTTPTDFIKHFDVSRITEWLNENGYYKVKDGEERLPKGAMVKRYFWKRISGTRWYTGEYRYFSSHPQEARELGFKEIDGIKSINKRYYKHYDQDGLTLKEKFEVLAKDGRINKNAFYERDGKLYTVHIPDYRTTRHWDNVRLGGKGQKKLNVFLVKLLCDEGRKNGITFGKKIAKDPIPIEGCRNDKDERVTWNGHYQKKMAKLDLTVDLEHQIPLVPKVIGGVDGDGEDFEEMIDDTINRVGNENIDSIWYDGGHNSYKNIALSYVKYRFNDVWYHLDDDWVQHKTFEHTIHCKSVAFEPDQEIKWRYNTFHNEADYKPHATLEEMMWYIMQKGYYEPVGAYFRNRDLTKYRWLDLWGMYHEKRNHSKPYGMRFNREEGLHGILKEQYHLEMYMDVRGLKNIERELIGILNASIAVALTKLQHGITNKLTSIAYIK